MILFQTFFYLIEKVINSYTKHIPNPFVGHLLSHGKYSLRFHRPHNPYMPCLKELVSIKRTTLNARVLKVYISVWSARLLTS